MGYLNALWVDEGTGAFNSWNDCILLTKRKNGSFTVGVKCVGLDYSGTASVYRSKPFRGGKALFEALDGCAGAMSRGAFDLGEQLLLCSKLAECHPGLAAAALRHLADTHWSSERRMPRTGLPFW